jgi:hypothetical protein
MLYVMKETVTKKQQHLSLDTRNISNEPHYIGSYINTSLMG